MVESAQVQSRGLRVAGSALFYLERPVHESTLLSIPMEDLLEDRHIDKAADIGALRAPRRPWTTSLLLPPDALKGRENDIEKGQRRIMNQGARDLCNMELLRRAQALIDFVDANVGPTIDYSIIPSFECDEAEREFKARFERLRSAAGVLIET